MNSVKTRFAPSPTGKLHIGSVRTALFCWLYARHTGGEYLVRIEDTDKERSTPENIDVIKENLELLNLTPNRPYVLQSKNEERHKEVVQHLLEKGAAYEDGGAVRFKVLPEDVVFTDLVQGDIRTPHNSPSMGDFVIARSDGTPTYNLAVTVDDHDMGITHVIRGDDHINNTPKQILIYQAMGWDVPAFAHTPLIHGADGKKMSKRHGATGTREFLEMGYLPEAHLAYLLRLGWSLGDEEIISMDKAIQHFELSNLNKGAAVFDFKKLDWVNGQLMKEAENDSLIELLIPLFSAAELSVTEEGKRRLMAGLDELKLKSKKLTDLAEASAFYLQEAPFKLNEKATEIMENGGKDTIAKLTEKLMNCDEWANEPLHQTVTDFVEETGMKFKDVGMPLRIALTGKPGGPSVSSVMEILGKKETMVRLECAKQL